MAAFAPARIEEIESCWPSLDLFFAKAFGFCVCTDNAVAGWCTGEDVSGRQIGIGIETMREYQNCGLATLAAAAFVAHAVAQGITPNWDSWDDNLPSLAVAANVGFKKVTEYTVHAGMLGAGG